MSWTRITYECGYFDQMHLTREYKEFTGTTPSIIAEDLDNAPFSICHKYH